MKSALKMVANKNMKFKTFNEIIKGKNYVK